MTGIKLLLITVICFVHKPNAENKTCLYELRTVMENIKKISLSRTTCEALNLINQ